MNNNDHIKLSDKEFARSVRKGLTCVQNMQVSGVSVSVKSDGTISSHNGKIVTYRASETTLTVNGDTLEVIGANIGRDGIVRGGSVKLNGQDVAPNCAEGVKLEKLGDDFAKVYAPAPYRNVSLNMRGPNC